MIKMRYTVRGKSLTILFVSLGTEVSVRRRGIVFAAAGGRAAIDRAHACSRGGR